MEGNQELKADFISAPITALQFYEDHLLAGEGPFLKIYEISSGQIICQKAVLHSAVIHRICKGRDSCFAIFGQKSLCVVRVQIHRQEIQVSIESDVCELRDWIWDVCWLDEETTSVQPPTQLAVVLAHNSVVRWDCKERLVLQQVHCAENCILYSALLIGSNWDNLIIASGTVFNQVVIWKPSTNQDSSQRCAVENRFSGHEGVIFNISYHANRKQLCSVSDDRSIRLWSIDDVSSDAALVLYGHIARVWDCRLLDDVIVSIGEDATCKVWNYSGDMLHTFTGHKGCSIWSLAVEEDKRILATGGGDSSIRLWRLDHNQPDVIITTDLVTVSPDVLPNLKMTADQEAFNQSIKLSMQDTTCFTPRHVTVINTGEILVMTQCGALLGYQPTTKSWRCLMYDPLYQSYSVLSVSPSNKMAALGNIDGKVKVLQIDSTETCYSEEHIYQSKVLNVTWASSDDLFVSGPDGNLDWLKITSDSSSTISLNLKAQFILPPARQRWATAVTMLPGDESIVCGDRRGSLHLFCHQSDDTQSVQSAHPCHTLPGIHGKTGVTSVCLHNGMLYSTGRDVTYKQYLLRRDEGDRLQIQLLNTFKVNKGFHWLEKIVFTTSEEMQVLGFHTNQFIVWSVNRNERLMEVECGGGHRTWGFTVSDDDGMATFACVKAQQVFTHRVPWQEGSRQSIIKQPLHGHQVTCVKHLASLQPSSAQGTEYAVCATGSEDTTVNIVMLHLHPHRPSHLKVLQRLQAHISRVCALASCPSQAGNQVEPSSHNQSVLLVSVGGRCALQCWRVNLKQKNDGSSSSSEVCCQVEHLVLYGTVDGVERRRLLKKSADLVDPETRYMDVTVWRDTSSVYIAVAGSDACVRLFALDETRRKLTLQSVTPCHNACVLSVRHLSYPANVSMAMVILTAATDGKIVFWDTRHATLLDTSTDTNMENEKIPKAHLTNANKIAHKFSKSLLELKHHSSGVNCLSIAHLHSGVFLVASGGDDNSISVSILRFSSSESDDVGVECLNTYKVPNAHAAQVSGLHFIDSSCFVSASVDQRVNLWKVEVSPNWTCIDKVQPVGSKFTHIADTSCLDVWISRSNTSHFIISGQGLQVLSTTSNKR